MRTMGEGGCLPATLTSACQPQALKPASFDANLVPHPGGPHTHHSHSR